MTSKNTASAEQELSQAKPVLGPGETLKKARMDAGLSVEEVATSLCLRAGVIDNLENEQFDALAGPVFSRGYLRAYSRLLSVNADEVIQSFNHLYASETPSDKMVWQARNRLVKKERPIRKLVVLISACVMVLAILWWRAHRTDYPTPSVASIEENVKDASLPEFDNLQDLKKQSVDNIPKQKTARLKGKKKGRRG